MLKTVNDDHTHTYMYMYMYMYMNIHVIEPLINDRLRIGTTFLQRTLRIYMYIYMYMYMYMYSNVYSFMYMYNYYITFPTSESREPRSLTRAGPKCHLFGGSTVHVHVHVY